jgi:hypothetical protein
MMAVVMAEVRTGPTEETHTEWKNFYRQDAKTAKSNRWCNYKTRTMKS